MISSLTLLIAALSMMSFAKRLNRKAASGVVPHVPMMQQAPSINTPVVTHQRLQLQPASFPTVFAALHGDIFPSLPSWTANGIGTQVSQQSLAPVVTYDIGDVLERARLVRASNLLDDMVVANPHPDRSDTQMSQKSLSPRATYDIGDELERARSARAKLILDDMVVPNPLGWTADRSDTQISQESLPRVNQDIDELVRARQRVLDSMAVPMARVTYDTPELDSARLARAQLLLDDMVGTKPSSPESGRSLPSTGVDTVKSLELKSFLGSWSQMYESVAKSNPAFGNAGQISEYKLNADGSTIDVVNTNSATGIKIAGTIKVNDSPGQGKYSFTSFTNRGGAKLDMKPYLLNKPDLQGDFLIYKLGPIKDGKYEYAIVGGPPAPKLSRDQTQLSVLARSSTDFKNKYDLEVQDWLKQNGFDASWNKPRATKDEFLNGDWVTYVDFAALISGDV